MGKANRTRKGKSKKLISDGKPRSGGNLPANGLNTSPGGIALAQLLESNAPPRLSLAGAYAWGFAVVALSQDDGPDWHSDTDPLDLIVLGSEYSKKFTSAGQFGNARTAWLRAIKTTPIWAGIKHFIATAVALSIELERPVDDGTLLLELCAELQACGLDDIEIPEHLRPGVLLAQSRFLRGGPETDNALREVTEQGQARAIDFLSRLDSTTDQDGTYAELLRDGLFLLETSGLPVHEDGRLLLIALFASLAASDEEPIDELSERAYTWALGLEDNTPIASIVDAVLAGTMHELDTLTILGHLFSIPEFTQIPDYQSLRWHGEPGTDFIHLALEFGHQRLRTRTGYRVGLTDESRDLLESQVDRFRQKFGRDPSPDEPIFFDPDADEPSFMDPIIVDEMWQSLAESTDSPLVRAFALAASEVGYIVTEENEGHFSKREKEAFSNAVERHLDSRNILEFLPEMLQQLIQMLIDGSVGPETPRSLIDQLVSTEEEDVDISMLVSLLVAVPLGWLVSIRDGGISQRQILEAVEWIHEHLDGIDRAGPALVVATALWNLDDCQTLEDHLGKRVADLTINDLHHFLGPDFSPAMVWLCTGLTATVGGGHSGWLHNLERDKKGKRRSKSGERKKKRRSKR
ncbi:hypothetical protein [Nocardia heshunensis]